jgi:D-alanyl-D-alanine dipeptidase
MMDNNLVDVQSINKEIDVKLIYSTTDNFCGEDLYGGMDKAYLVPELAVMLAKVQEKLTAAHPGYRLLVYDAARPQSVQVHMFNLVKDKYDTPEFYVSNPAKHGWHNYGAAVDVTIEDVDRIPLDMGTKFDCFEPTAHIDKEDELVAQGALSQEQKANRELLRDLMTGEGFETIPTEWWHFQKYSKYERNKRFKLLNF